MKRNRSNTLLPEKSTKKQVLQIGVLSAVLVFIIALMVWNTSGLNETLKRSTRQYVRDVSYQLTNDITTQLKAFEMALELTADSVPGIPNDTVLQRVLNRKADLLNFDILLVLARQGNTVPQRDDLAELGNLSGVQASFAGETSVVYTENQNLLFSAPVYRDGVVEQVIVGVCGQENVQALIQPKSFEGSGLSCIIDSSGQVVISPTDLKPFLQLDDIFKTGADARTTEAVLQMEQDLMRQASGAFEFTAVDDARLVITYHALGINDWVLLTLVPADLISGEASAYIFRSFLIVGGVSFLFTLFLFSVFWSYRKNRIRLEHIAFTDPVTGGMNNAAFRAEFPRLTEHTPPNCYVVVLLNVKGFKLINENFGIAAGDDMLKYIYNVLVRHTKEGEIAARSEADYFFLCLRENNPEEIQNRLDEIIQDINSFAQYTDIHYRLTMLQGACLADDPALDINTLQDRARIACRMQNDPEKCMFYSADLLQALRNEQELNALFEGSLQNRDFQIYLQPKVRLRDGAVCGAESLVRWFHPRRGMIYPSDFIPFFEKNDNICRLDLYVFEEVCALIRKWLDANQKLDFPISVNLSRAHFKNLNFLREFSRIKREYRIPDGVIELEVTESSFFDEQQRELVKSSIEQMHASGFQCSLDDFGVGFSSLALLQEFDVDTIKLDRHFFGDISNVKSQHVIASFIELAGKLGIHIVAEGIETEQQLAYLRQVNCDMVQGYIFSKPLPVSEFETWCRERTS
ncbi:MAG: bifunctional diguanylate cyclase/phosphodiesterase [Oscillospiraceae bacterium]|jgi:diguanylate cyclase (GGDEF)-like protein